MTLIVKCNRCGCEEKVEKDLPSGWHRGAKSAAKNGKETHLCFECWSKEVFNPLSYMFDEMPIVIQERDKGKKEFERMNKGEGYCPHNGMGYFTCPNCGCGEWVSYPQSGPSDRSKTWTWEYHCARCGKMMGLTLKGRDE